MIYVDYCLCGIPLKRGSYIIGIACMVLSAIKIILYSAAASNIVSLPPEVLAEDTFHNGIRGMLVVLIIIGVVEFFVGASLVYGAFKSRQKLIQAWLAPSKIMFPLNIVCYFVISLIYFVAPLPGAGIGALVFGVCNAIAAFFFFVIVNSHYRDLGFNYFP